MLSEQKEEMSSCREPSRCCCRGCLQTAVGHRAVSEGYSAADAPGRRAMTKRISAAGTSGCRAVAGESMSAGRLYDRFGDKGTATVRLITDRGIICSLNRKKK